MKTLADNYALILLALAAVFTAITSVYQIMIKTPNEKEETLNNAIKNMKNWLMIATVEAEKQFGSGTGQLKLKYVYGIFIDKFPDLATIISFEVFSEIVKDALKEMQHLIETNPKVKEYIEGE